MIALCIYTANSSEAATHTQVPPLSYVVPVSSCYSCGSIFFSPTLSLSLSLSIFSEVPPAGLLQAVQRGVWYSPFLHFIAFDIAYTLPVESLLFDIFDMVL